MPSSNLILSIYLYCKFMLGLFNFIILSLSQFCFATTPMVSWSTISLLAATPRRGPTNSLLDMASINVWFSPKSRAAGGRDRFK